MAIQYILSQFSFVPCSKHGLLLSMTISLHHLLAQHAAQQSMERRASTVTAMPYAHFTQLLLMVLKVTHKKVCCRIQSMFGLDTAQIISSKLQR